MAPGLSTNGSVGTDQLITDEQAKTIGRMWATENPQMMAFVRTGAIPYELIESLTTDARLLEAAVMHEDAPPVVARAQLRALTRYVQAYGPRGPLHGWREVGQADPVRGIIEPIVTENFRRAQERFEHRSRSRSQNLRPGGHGNHHLRLDFGPRPGASIYMQLGAPAIADVIVTWYKMMMNDPSVAPYFAEYDVEEIMSHQHAFLCVATGGPVDYIGRSIRSAHGQLGISNDHFDRMTEHLSASLAGAGVPGELHGSIMAKVEAFRSHVVND
jgi:hemoglobin